MCTSVGRFRLLSYFRTKTSVRMSKRASSYSGTPPVRRRKCSKVEMPKPAVNRNEKKLPVKSQAGAANQSSYEVKNLDVPTKSESDKKDYRIFRLSNGLTAVIVSDTSIIEKNESDIDVIPSSDEYEASSEGEFTDDDAESTSSGKKGRATEEKLAAASLCVGVGSFSDPLEFPGLAHFLEHMVFMGSKKYPKENDFDAFIKKRGGSNNAYTEWDCTTFYFESREDFLAESLDRFAQFFVEPLMKQESIAREREAVESEFQMSITSDTHRKQQLLCSLAEEGSPISKFPWGDNRTLTPKSGSVNGETILREQLFKFLRRHYSAHRMTLAVQGRMPLDELQEMVCKSFSSVPCNNLPSDVLPSTGEWVSPFPCEKFHKLYKLKPVKDICQVDLLWILPPKRNFYKTKPHEYLSSLVGHEGKGSLLSYLRKRVWALDIYAGVGDESFEDNDLFCQFSLSIVLTEAGLKNLEQVVGSVFGYLDMLKKECPNERIFKELQKIEEVSLRYLEEEAAVDYVETLSESLQYYPPKDILTGASLFYEYKPEDIKSVLSLLVPETVNILVLCKNFIDSNAACLTEPWFGTQYTVEDIPSSWLKSRSDGNFHLPPENIFLPNDFELLPVPNGPSPPHPVCVKFDESLELWFKQDLKFRLPQVHCCFYFISPIALSSPQTLCMQDMFVCLLKQQLVEEVYPADMAGLSFEIKTYDLGFILKVYGFHDKLPLLLETIIQKMMVFGKNLSEELFEAMKKKQLQAYYNTFLKPKDLARDVYLSLLRQTYWNNVEKHSALCQVTSKVLVEFVENLLLKRIYLKALVQGNVSEEKAIQMGSSVQSLLKYYNVIPRTVSQVRVCQIPLGEYYCRVKSFNMEDRNTSLTNYYQIGCITLESCCIVELLLMFMEEPLFDELRTKQQLGYNVSCSLRDTFGILGFTVTVNTHADKHNVDDVDNKVEDFLHSFYSLVMSPEGAQELEEVRDALIKIKSCVDNQLEEEVSKNWGEIISSDYIFDRLQREIKCLQELTVKDVRKWLKSHITKKKNLRKLSIQVVGNTEGKLEGESVQFVRDLKQLSKDKIKLKSPDESPEEISSGRFSAEGYGCNGDYHLAYLGGLKIEEGPTNRQSVGNVLTHCVGCRFEKKNGLRCEEIHNHFIMDIEGFKNELYIYPVTKTKFSS
ncbi:nardilysin [Ischnura elegans]|uniref:nardilysin n=1 Tax=Ischnura elegans TaxID=197161 RepID=UPI001ED86AE6|nr:nardilysin [Ischnura elegans]